MYKRCIVAAAMLTVFASIGAEPTVSEWSSPTMIDTRVGTTRTAKPSAMVQYAVRYVDENAADTAYVVVSKVVDADTAFAVTSVVSRCEAGTEDGIAFNLQAADSRRFRLIHAAYDAGGGELGEALVADVAVAYPDASSAVDALIDTRTNSLQLVAEARDPVALQYSTAWATGGVPVQVKITSVLDRYRKGTLVTSATNTLMTANAPATGDCLHQIATGGGTMTLLCSFLDANGEAVDEPLSASYRFKELWGFLLSIK